LKNEHPFGLNPTAYEQLVIAFAKLVDDLWTAEYTTTASVENLKDLFNKATNYPDYNEDEQNDTALFCMALFDALHTGLTGGKRHEDALEFHSFLSDTLAITFAETRYCTKFGKSTETVSRLWVLPLPLHLKHNKTKPSELIDQYLDEYFKEEVNTDKQFNSCPCGEKHKEPSKFSRFSRRILRMPTVICIQAMRYKTSYVDTIKGKVLVTNRLDTKFGTDDIHLSNYAAVLNENEKCKHDYELIATINHLGTTAMSGHYTAHVRHIIDGMWYECNDTMVRPLIEEKPNYAEERYLFFYRIKSGEAVTREVVKLEHPVKMSRELKKFNKLIGQIKYLQTRLDKGETLSKDEMTKVGRRAVIEAEIAKLS
jgi:ubiquitin C-terminal hydrolase